MATTTNPVRTETSDLTNRLPFAGPVLTWTRKLVRQWAWRMHGLFEPEDLLQEAWLCHAKILDEYPDATEPAHLMRLYQQTLKRRFIDLTRTSTRLRGHTATAQVAGDDEPWDEAVASSPQIQGWADRWGKEVTGHDDWDTIMSWGEDRIAAVLQDAPRPVRQVLQLLFNGPPAQLERIDSAWRAHGHRYTLANAHLCRLLDDRKAGGYNPKTIDLVKLVREYLVHVQGLVRDDEK